MTQQPKNLYICSVFNNLISQKMKSTLKIHQENIQKMNGYTGATTEFNGYIQFNTIHDENHNVLGFTKERIQKVVDSIIHPSYLYSRQTQYGINIYHRDNNSPTGVILAGGIPNELEFLLYALGKTGQLSPTEDKRTAH